MNFLPNILVSGSLSTAIGEYLRVGVRDFRSKFAIFGQNSLKILKKIYKILVFWCHIGQKVRISFNYSHNWQDIQALYTVYHISKQGKQDKEQQNYWTEENGRNKALYKALYTTLYCHYIQAIQALYTGYTAHHRHDRTTKETRHYTP